MLLHSVREDRRISMWWYLDGEGWDQILVRGRPDLANHAICLATRHFEVGRFDYVDRVGHLDDWALFFATVIGATMTMGSP
jgi:hypothetical protein